MRVEYSWKLFFDDSLVTGGSDSGSYVTGQNYPGNWYPVVSWAPLSTPYYSTFSFSVATNQVQRGNLGWTGMILYGVDNCSSSAWSPLDPLTLTIVSGSQYVSFHKEDWQAGGDTKLGATVVTTGDSIGYYVSYTDGVIPDSNNCSATVQAESDGIIKTYSVLIVPAADHFYVHAVPDTIEHSGITHIFTQTKNKSDQDMNASTNYYSAVLFSASPPGYGHLGWSAPSVTVNQKDKNGRQVTTSLLMNNGTLPSETLNATGQKFAVDDADTFLINSEAAKDGYVGYFADGTAPDNNTTITFNVTDYYVPSATGTGSVMIKGSGGPNLNFPRYSQGDPSWKDVTCDHTNGTIQQWGCALSEMAWVLSAYGFTINPLQLNDWMEDPNSPEPYYGPAVNWYAIDNLSGGNLDAVEVQNAHFGNLDYAHDVTDLANYLSNGDLVIAEVRNVVKNVVHEHWVVVEPQTNGEYPIVDARYGDRTTMEVYDNNVWEYVVVSRKKGKLK